MKFLAGIKYSFDSSSGHRLFLCLVEDCATLRFEAVQGTGAFIHIMNEQLKGIDWEEAREKAFANIGSIQPIQTIELDSDDLNHLARYRVD